jgi:hypothetical protein
VPEIRRLGVHDDEPLDAPVRAVVLRGDLDAPDALFLVRERLGDQIDRRQLLRSFAAFARAGRIVRDAQVLKARDELPEPAGRSSARPPARLRSGSPTIRRPNRFPRACATLVSRLPCTSSVPSFRSRFATPVGGAAPPPPSPRKSGTHVEVERGSEP